MIVVKVRNTWDNASAEFDLILFTYTVSKISMAGDVVPITQLLHWYLQWSNSAAFEVVPILP